MFSDKNYGLPKDLIEAAKRVHEKQLVEYDEDGYINNPPEGMDTGTKKDREKAAKMGLKGPHLEGEGRVTKKQKQNIPPLPVRKPKNEEVQFTEEELAEAFAIFLEENFHVEMLTEEDLDYVFEEEFPQWLEEARDAEELRKKLATTTNPNIKRLLQRRLDRLTKGTGPGPRDRATSAGTGSVRPIKGVTPSQRLSQDSRAEEDPMGDGSGVAKSVNRIQQKATADAVKSDTMTPPARNQVSAKPAASARKQTGGPSLFQQAKKAVRPTLGDPGRTATDRLKYMARRGNKASQKALRGPKKDWRSSVFSSTN